VSPSFAQIGGAIDKRLRFGVRVRVRVIFLVFTMRQCDFARFIGTFFAACLFVTTYGWFVRGKSFKWEAERRQARTEIETPFR
jgi:hypothetical protein